MNILNIRGRVVEEHLSCEVVHSWRLGLEFKTNETKGFSINHSHRGVRSESFRGVLKHFIVNWSITCVYYLDC